jgi:hypothetical protein
MTKRSEKTIVRSWHELYTKKRREKRRRKRHRFVGCRSKVDGHAVRKGGENALLELA